LPINSFIEGKFSRLNSLTAPFKYSDRRKENITRRFKKEKAKRQLYKNLNEQKSTAIEYDKSVSLGHVQSINLSRKKLAIKGAQVYKSKKNLYNKSKSAPFNREEILNNDFIEIIKIINTKIDKMAHLSRHIEGPNHSKQKFTSYFDEVNRHAECLVMSIANHREPTLDDKDKAGVEIYQIIKYIKKADSIRKEIYKLQKENLNDNYTEKTDEIVLYLKSRLGRNTITIETVPKQITMLKPHEQPFAQSILESIKDINISRGQIERQNTLLEPFFNPPTVFSKFFKGIWDKINSLNEEES